MKRTSSRRSRAFRALRWPQFRVVWATFLVGQLGFWVTFISLQALMARLTDSDGFWVGLLFSVSFAPTLLLTPVAGVVADRADRRHVLMATYALVGVLSVMLGALTLADLATPGRLLPFAAVIGSVFSFNAPAGQAMVAEIVPPDDLGSAVSLQSVGGNMSRVVGPTLAAPIVTVWNEGGAFLLYGVVCVAMIVMLGRADLPPQRRDAGDETFWARLRAGVRHARDRPPTTALLAILCASSLFAAGYLALLPVVADEAFDKGPSGFTTLAAVTGLGSIVGALVTGVRDTGPTLRFVGLSVAGFGVSLAVFATVESWNVALVAVAVVGFFYFAGMTSLSTMLQHLSDDTKRGRIMSLFQLGWAGLVPIAAVWEGLVAEAHGIRTAMVIAGGATAVSSLGVLAVGRARR